MLVCLQDKLINIERPGKRVCMVAKHEHAQLHHFILGNGQSILGVVFTQIMLPICKMFSVIVKSCRVCHFIQKNHWASENSVHHTWASRFLLLTVGQFAQMQRSESSFEKNGSGHVTRIYTALPILHWIGWTSGEERHEESQILSLCAWIDSGSSISTDTTLHAQQDNHQVRCYWDNDQDHTWTRFTQTSEIVWVVT